MWPARRRVFPLTLVFLAGMTSACIELDVVSPITRQSGELTEALRPLPKALIEKASHAVEDSLRPVLDSTVASLLSAVDSQFLALEHSLGKFVAGDLRDSVSVFLDASLARLRQSVEGSLDAWVATLATSARGRLLPLVDEELSPRLAGAADSAISRAAGALADRLDRGGDLRAALVALAEAVVDTALVTIAQNDQPTPWWLWALGIGFGLIVLAAVGIFILRLVRALKRREESLRLVTLAVKESGDPAIRDRVKQLAMQEGVEGWLNAYLRENRLLMDNGTRELQAALMARGARPAEPAAIEDNGGT